MAAGANFIKDTGRKRTFSVCRQRPANYNPRTLAELRSAPALWPALSGIDVQPDRNSHTASWVIATMSATGRYHTS